LVIAVRFLKTGKANLSEEEHDARACSVCPQIAPRIEAKGGRRLLRLGGAKARAVRLNFTRVQNPAAHQSSRRDSPHVVV
jgi:hypothetical protein